MRVCSLWMGTNAIAGTREHDGRDLAAREAIAQSGAFTLARDALRASHCFLKFPEMPNAEGPGSAMSPVV
jgi:hypothetical protein